MHTIDADRFLGKVLPALDSAMEHQMLLPHADRRAAVRLVDRFNNLAGACERRAHAGLDISDEEMSYLVQSVRAHRCRAR